MVLHLTTPVLKHERTSWLVRHAVHKQGSNLTKEVKSVDKNVF